MGIFKYPLEIGSAEGSRYERVEALVDTGAMYSWVPASILRSLGLIDNYMLQITALARCRVAKK